MSEMDLYKKVRPRMIFVCVSVLFLTAPICITGCNQKDDHTKKSGSSNIPSGCSACGADAFEQASGASIEIKAYSQSLKERELAPSELLKEAMAQLEAKDDERAILVMYLFLAEVEASGPRLMGIYQDVRFKLASLLVKNGRKKEAAELLKEYLDCPLVEREQEARAMLNDCSNESKDEQSV